FHSRYRKQDRRIRLSDAEKANLIRNQGGTCRISGAQIFVGDDVEVDHAQALAIGGPDSLENLQISTPQGNRRKGPRQNPLPADFVTGASPRTPAPLPPPG